MPKIWMKATMDGPSSPTEAPLDDVSSKPEEPRQRFLRVWRSASEKPFLVLCAVIALISAGLLVYSQTAAFHWDEGFHLLAAQLIGRGKKPYIDFCFPQTPLNAYWNAGWMWILGDTWRTAHLLATLMTAGAMLLIAQYILTRFPVPGWRLAGAISAAVLFGLNMLTVDYGTIGQAYGLFLLLLAAAFRLAILSVERRGPLLAAVAGLLAGCAAGASLLTAFAGPVLLVWILVNNRAGSRVAKFAAFAAGAAISFVPELLLFTSGPAQTKFNILDYHLFYRRVDWSGATENDLDVLTGWINRLHDFILILLAGTGVWFFRKQAWERRVRSELYLCIWLAGALVLESATAHPTFHQYFISAFPFLTILAIPGLYLIGSRLDAPDRPVRTAIVLTCLILLGVGRGLYVERDSQTWAQLEAAARKVIEVTPRTAELQAPEQIYFLTRRPPPDGMEFAFNHHLNFSPAMNSALHILPQENLNRQTKAGRFGTVVICDDDDKVSDFATQNLYSQKTAVGNCTLFWNFRTGSPDVSKPDVSKDVSKEAARKEAPKEAPKETAK
jgi:hypothetical protein